MKQIISEQNDVKKISINEIYTNNNLINGTIVAYVTDQGTGLVISVQDLKSGWYGFKYHNDLITDRHSDKLTYSARTKSESFKNVLRAGRELFIFDDFAEFVKYAAQRSKL